MKRQPHATVTAALMTLVLIAWLATTRWLIGHHLVELLRPIALLGLSTFVLLILVGFLPSIHPSSTRASTWLQGATWLTALLMIGFCLSIRITYQGISDPARDWVAVHFTSVSARGQILSTLGDPLPFYSEHNDQRPLVLDSRDIESPVAIGMVGTSSHSNVLAAMTFDRSGCRAYWLRLEPAWPTIHKILTDWSLDPSDFAETSWPARLYWTDVCESPIRKSRTEWVLPNLRTGFAPIDSHNRLITYTGHEIRVFDVSSTPTLLTTTDLPQTQFTYWITTHSFSIEGSTLRVVREQYSPSLLETLEVDLNSGEVREVSLIDLQRIPASASHWSSIDLLAVGPSAKTAITSSNRTERQDTGEIQATCTFDFYNLTEGELLFSIERDQCHTISASAIYLPSGQLAFGESWGTSGGRIRIISRSGQTVANETWKGARNLWLAGLLDGRIVVSYSLDETSFLDWLDFQSSARGTIITGYRPFPKDSTFSQEISGGRMMLIGDDRTILSVDESLQTQVLWSLGQPPG